ncbi:MAG: rRNA adenine methyltransferase [Chryseolinea sp.]
MQFDPNNPVFKLCAQGMDFEGIGNPEEASKLFIQAWAEASNDLEKLTAAHYVARHQQDAADKLRWDEVALHLALNINSHDVKGLYPSLYLNVGKGYEDLGDVVNARRNYETAHSFVSFLPDDGYGNMIKGGIGNGLRRLVGQ